MVSLMAEHCEFAVEQKEEMVELLSALVERAEARAEVASNNKRGQTAEEEDEALAPRSTYGGVR